MFQSFKVRIKGESNLEHPSGEGCFFVCGRVDYFVAMSANFGEYNAD